MVIRISGSKKNALNFDVSSTGQLRYQISANSNELIVSGKAPAHVDPSYYNPAGKEHVVYDDTTGCYGIRFQYRIKAMSKDGAINVDTSGPHHIKESKKFYQQLRPGTWDKFQCHHPVITDDFTTRQMKNI